MLKIVLVLVTLLLNQASALADTGYRLFGTVDLMVVDDGIDPYTRSLYDQQITSLPRTIRLALQKYRVRIIYGPNQLRDFPSFPAWKRSILIESAGIYDGAELGDMAGLVDGKDCYISDSATDDVETNSVALHEIGHVVQALIERSPQFHKVTEIFNRYNLSARHRIADHRFTNSKEFFAEAFSEFFGSEDSNEELFNLYPDMANFLKDDLPVAVRDYVDPPQKPSYYSQPSYKNNRNVLVHQQRLDKPPFNPVLDDLANPVRHAERMQGLNQLYSESKDLLRELQQSSR